MSASMYVGRLGGLAVGLGIGVAIGAGMSAASAAPSDSSPSGASTPRPAATGPVAAAKATVARAVVSQSPRITRVAVAPTAPATNDFAGKVFATGSNLVYSMNVPVLKTEGSEIINTPGPYLGTFTWSPTIDATHAAAKIGAGIADRQPMLSFTVTNNVYPARPSTRTVRVKLFPTNEAPDVNQSYLDNLDNQTVSNYPAGNGKTYGDLSLAVSDGDEDVLSFSGSKTYAAGIFTVSKAGLWNFAPTFAAAHAAALTGATTDQKQATVSFAVDDGYKGGKVLGTTFNVAIAKYNRTPVATQYTIGTPDTSSEPGTTKIAGTIFGTDADNDTLAYAYTGADYGTANINSGSGVYLYEYDNAGTGSALPGGVTWTNVPETLVTGTYTGTTKFYVSMNDGHNGAGNGGTPNGIGTFEATVPISYALTYEA